MHSAVDDRPSGQMTDARVIDKRLGPTASRQNATSNSSIERWLTQATMERPFELSDNRRSTAPTPHISRYFAANSLIQMLLCLSLSLNLASHIYQVPVPPRSCFTPCCPRTRARLEPALFSQSRVLPSSMHHTSSSTSPLHQLPHPSALPP